MKRVKNKTVQKQCLAMVICLALCLSMLSPITYSVAATAATESEPAKQTISLDGVQMRGAMNGWYYYLVLKSDAYSTLSTNVEVIENAPELSSMDKIRLYTSAEDTTGTALSELTVQHIGRNIWGENGAFINFAEYDTTHGGHQVYKIVIEEGCELLADTDTIYVVDKTYTYINNSYGDESKKLSAFEWTLEETPEISKTEISVDGVQMRGAMNGWYYYLVLKSDAYSTLSANVETIENAITSSTLDKIRLYTSAEDTTGVALSDLTVQHIGRNIWGENGAFINFAEYDTTYGSHQVYKIVIEEGCELLADTDTIYVVDQTYTYYNGDYGDESKKLEAFNWTTEAPSTITKTEISLSGVQMRGAINGWYYYLVLQSDAYSALSANVEDITDAATLSTLNKIRLYTSAEDTTGTALSDLTIQHIGRNIWGVTGAFINFAEYDSTHGGHQVYKIVIEEGCELLADTNTIYVVDKTYTYFNGDFGDESKKLEAFNWMPGDYLATFVADGVVVDRIPFFAGDSQIAEPEVPAKAGYIGRWEAYNLDNGDVTIHAVYEKTSVVKWNLVLCDEIAANFYVRISDTVNADAVMYVKDGYGTHQYPLSEIEKDSDGNYIFTARLAVAQLSDTIVLQLHDGETLGPVHSYTAVDYAHYVLQGEFSAGTKSLVKAMLNYGAAAQTYFNYNLENPSNAGYEDPNTLVIPAADNSSVATGSAEGIRYYGATLVFQSKIAVRFYFVVTGDINSYTFSTGKAPVLKDGMYYVEVPDINPQDYDQEIVLTVNDSLTVTYSPLDYICRQYHNSDKETLVNLVAEMYRYHKASEDYLLRLAYTGNEYHISTDETLAEAANELNHRLLRYDEMRIGDADIPEASFNAFNMGWQASALLWQNATEEAYGADKITPIYTEFLYSRTQDDYGYIYNQGDFREDPLWGGNASWGSVVGGPQGWTFPTWTSAVEDPFADFKVANGYFTSFDFNYEEDNASKNWSASNGTFDSKYHWSLFEDDVMTDGYADFSTSSSIASGASYKFYNESLSNLLTKYGGFVGSQAAFVEIDMDFVSSNLDDVRLVWKTKNGGDTWYSASAKEYVTVGINDYSTYGARSYWPMYLNENWNGQIITALGVEFVPVSGTTLSITNGKLNYIRGMYDTRQPQFAFQWMDAFYNYVSYTQDETVLKQLMPKARKTMLFMLHCLQGENGLVNMDFFSGHNGIGTTINADGSVTTHPGEGIGSGYWDTLALSEINLESNAYFYTCLQQMAVLEAYCEENNISIDEVSIKNRVIGEASVTYDYNSEKLYALMDQVKARFSEDIKPVLEDDGRYTNEGGLWNPETGRFALGINEATGEIVDHGYVLFNEQAIVAGLGTDEQRLSVMQWINGDRIVDGDLSTGDDIYFYEFAPRFNTADCLSQFNFGLAELNFGDSSAWKVYGTSFSRSVQNGGAVLWASYYDIIARAQVLGTDNAYERIEDIAQWYSKVNSTTTGTGTNFFQAYYDALEGQNNTGIYKRQAANAGGVGAIGIDSEFLENVILVRAIPDAFYEMTTDGLKQISFTNHLPEKIEYLKLDNLKLGSAFYSVYMNKNEIEVDVIKGTTADNTNLYLRFTEPEENYTVYINGNSTSDYTVENGYIVVEILFGNVTVTVK